MLALVTAPLVSPVSLDEAKRHLRVEHSDDDAMIGDFIAAATAELDGEAGLLGRALLTQTWRLTLRAGARLMELPLPPLQEVTAVTYRDRAGTTVTLGPDRFEVWGIGASGPAEIAFTFWPPGFEAGWPVMVTFRAGYGDDPADVPAPIRTAILQRVANLYSFRGDAVVRSETVDGVGSTTFGGPASTIVASKLDAYRVWSF